MQLSTTTDNSYDTIFQIRTILREKETIKRLYLGNQEHFSQFLLSILKDKRYDLVARSEIAWDELYKIVNIDRDINDTDIFINDKKALQDILLECLKDKMNELKVFDGPINGLYLKNLEDIAPVTRQIKVTKEANLAMKEFILAYPFEYLKKYFLREYPEISFNGVYYHLDPFLLQYFDDSWDEIDIFLKSDRVKKLFSENQSDSKFYTYLLHSFEKAKEQSNNYFLVIDTNFIDKVGEYIVVKQKRVRLSNSSS
jgi:hypothetical protein